MYEDIRQDYEELLVRRLEKLRLQKKCHNVICLCPSGSQQDIYLRSQADIICRVWQLFFGYVIIWKYIQKTFSMNNWNVLLSYKK